MRTLKISLILLAIMGISSCDNSNQTRLSGSVDRSGKSMTTTIYLYDSVEEVQDKFREVHNLPKDHKTNVQGFARWPEFRDANGKPVDDGDNELTCVIHTVRPTHIDDEATLTLGHEMLHCVVGTYHQESSH